MVKMLAISELPELAKLGPQFYEESGLPGKFVPEYWVGKWASLIRSGVGFVLGLFKDGLIVGGFGAIVSEDFNNGDLVAAECFWFVNKEHRGPGFGLMRAYEREARRRGAKRASMIHLQGLQPERLSELYQRCGYRKTETAYIKELN